MQLTTPVDLKSLPFTIPLGTPIFALGSCFAARVGERLANHLFPTILNPYGTLYNPESLATVLRPEVPSSGLFLHHGAWRSLAHHSSLGAKDPCTTRARLLQAEKLKREALEQSQVLLLTLGTSQAFELRNGQRVIANCHRLPQQLFRRRRLSCSQCLGVLQEPLVSWLEADPQRRAIVTVSPVRYTRDGLVNNSRAKAALLLTCEALENEHPRIHYFPAYEILVDELRDYRYYEADMAHPTALALEIVWRRFCNLVLDSKAVQALGELERLWKARQHRFTADSDPIPLARRSLRRIQELGQAHPGLDLSSHHDYFQSLLEKT